MPKRPTPAPEIAPDVAKLAEVVAGLTHQVRHLALLLDEVREELIWAVRQDKFSAAGASQRYVEKFIPTSSPEDDDDELSSSSAEPAPIPTAEDTRVKRGSKQTLF